MIREKIIDKGVGDRQKLRWRSHEISRIGWPAEKKTGEVVMAEA